LKDPRYDENFNEWSSADDPTLTGMVNANIVRVTSEERDLIRHIIIGILRHLHDKGDRALANSIWHSLRHDALPDHENGEPKNLPDDVGDLLLAEELLRNPWLLIDLDCDRYDSFYQIWLLDRAIEEGFLWVGYYIDANGESLVKTSEIPDNQVWPWLGRLRNILPFQNKDDQPAKKESIMERRQLGQWGAGTAKAILLLGKNDTIYSGSFDSHNPDLDCFYTGGEETEAERFRKVAVFDMDGPCLVATPFDSDKEWLPRPEDRSMDICWVIEHVGNDEEEPGSRQYRVLANVKGMWEIIEEPSQRYNFI